MHFFGIAGGLREGSEDVDGIAGGFIDVAPGVFDGVTPGVFNGVALGFIGITGWHDRRVAVRSWTSLWRVRITGFGPGAAGVLLLRFEIDTHWERRRYRCRCRCSVRHPNGLLDVERLLGEVLHKLQMTWCGCSLHQDWHHQYLQRNYGPSQLMRSEQGIKSKHILNDIGHKQGYIHKRVVLHYPVKQTVLILITEVA